MSKEGKLPKPIEQRVLYFPVENTKPSEQRSPNADRPRAATERFGEVTRLNNEATRKSDLRYAMETAKEPAKIVELWKQLRAAGETEHLHRSALRRIDMHVALTDPTVVAHMTSKSHTVRDLVDTLNHHTSGNGEPDARPHVINKNGPFSHLKEGEVEPGANERTHKEHRRAQLGVEVALLTTRMRDILHILDSQIGTTLGNKLTVVEKACINDHITAILNGGHWEHPTQDMARSFATWEKILGDVHNATKIKFTPERANFLPEPTFKYNTTPSRKRRIPLLTNVINTPRDGFREFRKLLLGDD